MSLSGAAVYVNSPIGTVTGGWYREKELSFTVDIGDSLFPKGDLYIEGGNHEGLDIGIREINGWKTFSTGYL